MYKQRGSGQENQVKHTYKDSIFRYLFNDKEKISELYGAISGDEIERESVEIVTLKNVIFNGLKNDLAFTVDSKLIVMIEHQSTDNPNMPVRMLCYLGKIYEMILDESNLYGSKQIEIPAPELYVFYNGATRQEEEWMNKLSDSFKVKTETQFIEVMVKTININYVKGNELLRKCKSLEGYSILVHKIKAYYKESQDLNYSTKKAIKECIQEGILVEFLKKNKGEIMSILNFTLTKEQMREIDFNEGMEQGELNLIRKMKGDGIPIEMIMKYTSLSREIVETA